MFDGSKKLPFSEADTPNPLNVYGKTKLAGERAIQASGVAHLILRTSWVYGARGRNFLLTILKLFREKSELKIVDDQFGAPTWSRMLAEVTSLMLAQYYSPISRSSASVADISGLYHLVSGGTTSWHGFATKILETTSTDASHPLPKLQPVATSEYPLPAKRPLNSSLSTEKLKSTFGMVLPSWEKSLMLCMDEDEETSAV